MKKIALRGKYGLGKFALVDDEDFELVSKYKWYINNKGYVTTSKYLGGGRKNKKLKTIFLHKLILNISGQVDHKNRNKLDNRIENLRPATSQENNMNKALSKNNKSGFKGVRWAKHIKRWRAAIGFNYKLIELGCFKSKTEAAQVYNEAALKYFGAFAHLNMI